MQVSIQLRPGAREPPEPLMPIKMFDAVLIRHPDGYGRPPPHWVAFPAPACYLHRVAPIYPVLGRAAVPRGGCRCPGGHR